MKNNGNHRVNLSGQNIVITSNEEWGDIWLSKHNYAYELSKKNNVFFINPQGSWKFKNLWDIKIHSRKYSDNLTIIDYNNPLPILGGLLFAINNFLVSRKLRKFFEKQRIENFVLWAFDPFRLYNPKLIGAKFSIFHSVDLYDFKHPGEKRLAKNADVVFCVSEDLAKRYKEFSNSIYSFPHGISKEDFVLDNSESSVVDIKFKDYGLYIGGIDYRVNYKLLEEMLMKFPDKVFLFVGYIELPVGNEPAHRIFVKKKYKNLHYQGAVHYKKLKFYVAKAAFCLSILDHEKPENSISLHKTLLYLAFGKPIFGSYCNAHKDIQNILYESNNDDVVLQRLQLFLDKGEDRGLVAKRMQYAENFTFDKIFEQIEKILID